jgi:hypothetical protein
MEQKKSLRINILEGFAKLYCIVWNHLDINSLLLFLSICALTYDSLLINTQPDHE